MASVPTKEMKLTEARAHFSEILNEVHRDGTRVAITKAGIPVATIISPSDMERFKRLEADREKDFEVFDEFSRQLAAIPDDEFEREFAKALKEVREDMDRERLASEAG